MKCNITWLYWLLGITIFCIDRITKNAALVSFMEKVESGIPLLSYEMTLNRGISWGMLHSHHNGVFILISLIIAVATILIAINAYICSKKGETVFGQVCIIAGSLSNLIDRMYYHGVIDFIVIAFRDYAWPVFNIADMAIVIGIGILVWQHTFFTTSKNAH